MEPITIALLAGGAYVLLKKKSTASTAPDGGRTVVNLPAAEWEDFMDDWTRKDDARRTARRSRYGADPDTWEELLQEPMRTLPMPGYETPGILGPAQAPAGSTQLGEFIPGISDTWVYLGGAAAAYYFFLRKK